MSVRERGRERWVVCVREIGRECVREREGVRMGESNYEDISLLFPGSLKRRYLYCSSVHFISISGEIETERDSEDRESKRERHRETN